MPQLDQRHNPRGSRITNIRKTPFPVAVLLIILSAQLSIRAQDPTPAKQQAKAPATQPITAKAFAPWQEA